MILLWLAGGPATIDMWDNKPDAPDEDPRRVQVDRHQRPPACSSASTCPRPPRSAISSRVVRSLNHTIPAHGPGAVFMTDRQQADRRRCNTRHRFDHDASDAAVRRSSVRDLRRDAQRQRRPATSARAINPFVIEGNDGRQGRRRQLPRPRGHAATGVHAGRTREPRRPARKFDGDFAGLDRLDDLVDGSRHLPPKGPGHLRRDKTARPSTCPRKSRAARGRTATRRSGQGVLAARRLIEAGVRFVTVSLGGWDTHGQNFQALPKQRLPARSTRPCRA